MPRKLWSIYLTLTLALLFSSAIANPLGRVEIVNTAFTVKAGDAKYWNFQVGSAGASVVGRFRAEGGSGNDIKCLILDADSFENWRNGHKVRTYYNSEKITVAKLYSLWFLQVFCAGSEAGCVIPALAGAEFHSTTQPSTQWPGSVSSCSDTRLSLNALPITDTELKLIAAAAIIGLRSKPKNGYNTPAAIGTPSEL